MVYEELRGVFLVFHGCIQDSENSILDCINVLFKSRMDIWKTFNISIQRSTENTEFGISLSEGRVCVGIGSDEKGIAELDVLQAELGDVGGKGFWIWLQLICYLAPIAILAVFWTSLS